MYTISDILRDIDRGCMVYNMVEDRFSYRIIFFVNDGNKGVKHYFDTSYSDLREALENIIKNNLTLTNTVVIAETTTLMNRRCVCLQSRSYAFCLDEYFRRINGEHSNNRYGYAACGKYAVR